MSSFGHVRDMMGRYAANRELLNAKRHRHFRKTKSFNDTRYKQGPKKLTELDKAEWEKLKERIRKDKIRERWLLISVSAIAVLSLLWAFKSWFL